MPCLMEYMNICDRLQIHVFEFLKQLGTQNQLKLILNFLSYIYAQ